MRKFIFIICILMCTNFSFAQEIGKFRAVTILDFAKTQLADFEIIKTAEKGLNVDIPRFSNFNNKKIEVTLKAKKSHSNKNSYNKTVYTRIKMEQFEFETKEICKQAMDSLLNCFPYDCFKIERYVNQGVKMTPSVWIFNEQRIIIAQTACEQVDEKWTKFKKKFVNTFANSDTEIIVTECGYLTWKTKEEILNEK